jgi:hypothetical protein
LAASTSTANVTFEFVGDRFPPDYSAIFLDHQSDGFPFIEEGTLYLFARLFYRPDPASSFSGRRKAWF